MEVSALERQAVTAWNSKMLFRVATTIQRRFSVGEEEICKQEVIDQRRQASTT